MKKIIVFTMILAVLSCFGCDAMRLIAPLSTPTSWEKKIPAEYDISQREDGGILVLVEQAGWLNPGVNFPLYLTEAINLVLAERAKIEPESFVEYSKLAAFRAERIDFSELSPVEIGSALEVDTVLFVMIENYELYELAGTGYYKGTAKARAVLFDVQAGEVLWPESGEGKIIEVEFDIAGGKKGEQTAAERLIKSTTHNLTRYLYDCRKNQFRGWDDKVDYSWGKW